MMPGVQDLWEVCGGAGVGLKFKLLGFGTPRSGSCGKGWEAGTLCSRTWLAVSFVDIRLHCFAAGLLAKRCKKNI
jgi:hypothetical protein